MKLTSKLLHEAGTNYMGWNREQLSLLGVNWPPKIGWLRNLVGTDIPVQTWEKVIALRGVRRKKDRQRILGEPYK